MDVSKRSEKNLLDLMHNLVEENASNRINACKKIFILLLQKQGEVENQNEPCEDLKYTLQRLIKGLASPRKAARIGYALLLTEIVKHINVVRIEEVLELIAKYLPVTMKQDKHEYVFGQLFAYSALTRSGKLVHHDCLSRVVLSLSDLCHGKIYILNASYKVILNLLTQLSTEKFKENVWPDLKKKISVGWENCSSDFFWLLLLCYRMFPKAVSSKYLKKYWGNEDIFSSENTDNQKRIIKQTTGCLPELHPLCVEFLLLTKERKDFREIWVALVDENLFEVHQTEKTFVGFQMIKRILQNVLPKQKMVKCILSSRFQTVFSKTYMDRKHPLNPAAIDLAEFFCDYVKDCSIPGIQIIILKMFLQQCDVIFLDQLLKKKEMLLIIQYLLPDAVKAFYDLLKSVLIGRMQKSTDGYENEVSRWENEQVIMQIGKLVSHPATIADVEWRISVVKFLFLHSFFRIKEASSDILHCEQVSQVLPKAVLECYANNFYNAVDSLFCKVDGQTPLPQFLQHLLALVDYVDQLLTSPENVVPMFPMEKVQELWDKMKFTVHKLIKQSQKDGKVNESSAFQVLFLQLGFLLFHDPHHIPEVLEELFVCCKKGLKTRKHSGKISELKKDEPPWIRVLVDILLALLSKPSHHLRNLVMSVFPLFCSFITTEALQQILDVIDPQKEEEPILVDESDEENVQFESGSSSEESDTNEANEIHGDEEFKRKVKEALGPAADVSDVESVALSDSEMFKLDNALSEAFRSRTKAGKEVDSKMLLHFRIRCLDLIIIYLKSEPPVHFVLQCIQPLISAYEHEYKNKVCKPFVLKILSTFKVLMKIKKLQCDNLEKSEVKQLLQVLILKCHKETDLTVASKLYSLCVFLVLCFRRIKIDESPSGKASSKKPAFMKIYLSALATFRKESHLSPQFFTSLMDACPDLAWNFIEPCANYAFCDDTRIYKKTQCLGLILAALKFSKNQKFISTNEWLELGNKLIPFSLENIKNVLSNPDIKPVYFTELLNVLYACHSIVKEKTNQSPLEEHADLVQLLNSMEKNKVKRLTGKGNAVRRKIILALGGRINGS